MKVKVVANELVDTNVEFVSLVRHGANRCPFKILKSEDSPATLGDKLQDFFALGRGDAAVVAYFIRKDATEALLPLLKAQGVNTDDVTETDGVTVVKQSDHPARGFIQLGDALAVAINQPVREFSDESIVKAYADGLGLSGFAPGVRMAVGGLDAAVWSLLNPAAGAGSERETRIAKVDAMLASFRKYITALAKLLPEQVFKVESAVHTATNEDSDMRKATLTEAVPGDLEGLRPEAAPAPVVKTEAAPEPTPVAEPPAATADATPETPPAEPVAKSEPPADALSQILAQLTSMNARIDGIEKSVNGRLEAAEAAVAARTEAERAALAKAEATRRATTVVDRSHDADLALSTLGGGSLRPRRGEAQVVKSQEEVWDGLMPDLDTFRRFR